MPYSGETYKAMENESRKIKEIFTGLGGKKNRLGVRFSRDVTIDEISNISKKLGASDFGRARSIAQGSSYCGAWFDLPTKGTQLKEANLHTADGDDLDSPNHPYNDPNHPNYEFVGQEGDMVQVIGPVAGEGQTGRVKEVAPSGKFYWVKLLNGDTNSYHGSDLKGLEDEDGEDDQIEWDYDDWCTVTSDALLNSGLGKDLEGLLDDGVIDDDQIERLYRNQLEPGEAADNIRSLVKRQMRRESVLKENEFEDGERYPKAIRGEEVYRDWDEESASYCVFGVDSGHAYASYASSEEADNKVERMERGRKRKIRRESVLKENEFEYGTPPPWLDEEEPDIIRCWPRHDGDPENGPNPNAEIIVVKICDECAANTFKSSSNVRRTSFNTVTESISQYLNTSVPGYWYKVINPIYEYRANNRHKVISLPSLNFTGRLLENKEDKFIRLENKIDSEIAARYGLQRIVEDDYENTITCKKCGTKIEKDRGNDVDCPKCNQTHNCFGQVISHPYGRGEDYAGERWDDDY